MVSITPRGNDDTESHPLHGGSTKLKKCDRYKGNSDKKKSLRVGINKEQVFSRTSLPVSLERAQEAPDPI